MSFDFNEIAKRALEQGHLDAPRSDEKSPSDEIRHQKMFALDDALCDLCSNAEAGGLHVGDVLMVVSTFFGKAIVQSVCTPDDAVRLFMELAKACSEAMALAIQDRNRNG